MFLNPGACIQVECLDLADDHLDDANGGNKAITSQELSSSVRLWVTYQKYD